jgi:DNA-binding NtrC family response regulator
VPAERSAANSAPVAARNHAVYLHLAHHWLLEELVEQGLVGTGAGASAKGSLELADGGGPVRR